MAERVKIPIMPAWLWRFAVFVVLLLSGWVPAPVLAEVLVATDIRVGLHPERTRFVIDLSGKAEFHVFSLPDPYRVVIDLPETDWRLPAGGADQRGGVIDGLRYGLLQAGVSRVVLDLARPATVAASFLIPPREGKDYRLVVDLAPADRGAFLAALGVAPPPPAPAPALQASLPPPAPLADLGPPGRKPEALERRIRIIVIDPGHGGVDPGAIAPSGMSEKEITLAAARDFKRRLEATGRYEVHLTREKDIFLRLRDRIAIARAKRADLFISVHANTIASRKVRGFSVYTLSETASDREAAALAEEENKADLISGLDLSVENPEVTNILIDLAQRETMNESARLAGHVVTEVKAVSKILPNAHRFAGFAVLKAPDVPSILVELGFLSNPQDERALKDPRYRARMADALARAVGDYFQTVEKAERD